MAEFCWNYCYRTWKGVAPDGLPFLYLTGHPQDLEQLGDTLITDITEAVCCAVYWDETAGTPYSKGEVAAILNGMRMLAVPVTRRFLEEPNRARDVDILCALELGIPVLPVALEPDLGDAFNRCFEDFGHLQILKKDDADPSGLPYQEKLRRRLLEVVADRDGLTERVRKHFRARIFLSYRKKDRDCAQDLMRRIHQTSCCWDLGVWYDEFLTPGEDFNANIARALSESALVVLAVTPNITEPGNYVREKEYQTAVEAGIPVLPVELVPTDRKELEEAFPGLPPCVGYDGLAAALEEAVGRLDLPEDGTPEHAYIMGLAYLNGIDTETDRARGISLIT